MIKAPEYFYILGAKNQPCQEKYLMKIIPTGLLIYMKWYETKNPKKTKKNNKKQRQTRLDFK